MIQYVITGVYVGVSIGLFTLLPAGFMLGVLWIQLTRRGI